MRDLFLPQFGVFTCRSVGRYNIGWKVNMDEIQQLLHEMREMKKEIRMLRSILPPYLRMKDLCEFLHIGKDSLYKFILPRVQPRIMGRIKLYKTSEVLEVVESYKEFIPDIHWPI